MRDLNLKERIETNDNRSTALPYLLLLQERRTYVAHDNYCNNTETRYTERLTGDYLKAETKKDLIKELTDSGHNEKEIEENIIEFQEGEYWETTNVFLTDKGYQDHLSINRHNLGRHRTYGIHAFRNNEMKKVYELIQNDFTKDQRIKELEDAMKDILQVVDHLAKSNHPYTVHEHRDTLENRFGLQIEVALQTLERNKSILETLIKERDA